MHQLGRQVRGKMQCDSSKLTQLMMTEDKHRLRSEAAEEVTEKAAAVDPLPVGARNGGNKAADPNSMQERILSESAVTCLLPRKLAWPCCLDLPAQFEQVARCHDNPTCRMPGGLGVAICQSQRGAPGAR